MHVAIVGAGALGTVFGGYLAVRGGATVTLVVRPEHARDAGAIRLERVEDGDVVVWRDPTRATAIPGDADVVIVCVRHEQIDAALIALLEAGPDVPAVIMTPMLPPGYERLCAALPGRVVAGMPGVVAYANDAGAVRHWLPRVASTQLEETRPIAPATQELATTLSRAGIATKFELGVHELNPATTVSFVPILMALDVAGGIDPLLADDALLQLGLDGAQEGIALARTIGKTAPWAGLLLKFIGPTTLRLGAGLARSRAPEAVAYVDQHFGHKLRAQNLAMARGMVDLATTRGTPHEALSTLLERLEGAR
jgi:2-dehydropantoate 2-reductase